MPYTKVKTISVLIMLQFPICAIPSPASSGGRGQQQAEAVNWHSPPARKNETQEEGNMSGNQLELEGFEAYPGGRVGARQGDMTVGVGVDRSLNLTRAVMVALGEPTHLKLFWNPATKTIALKAVTADVPGAIPIRKAASQNSWSITLMGFVGYYRLRIKETRRYPVKVEDRTLLVSIADNVETDVPTTVKPRGRGRG